MLLCEKKKYCFAWKSSGISDKVEKEQDRTQTEEGTAEENSNRTEANANRHTEP